VPATAVADIDNLLMLVAESITPNTEIVIMSNGGFEGFHSRLVERISAFT
jgi:UDP-N-acetylmuramate-alanine ligase